MSPEYRATLRKSQRLARERARTNRQPLRLATLFLAVLSVCLSISILGTAGHAYNTYRTQQAANNPWWLPLWPGHFDITGTKALIGASIGVMLMNSFFVGLSLIPKLDFHGQSLRAMVSAVVLSTASSLLSLVAVVISAVLNNRKGSRESLQTWTCRWSSDSSMYAAAVSESDRTTSNDKFAQLCTESRYAFWTMVTIVILQAALLVVAVTHWAMAMWKKYTKEEDTERSKSTDMELGSIGSVKVSEEFAKQRY